MAYRNGLHDPPTLPETGLIWGSDPLPPQSFPGGAPTLPKLPTLPKPPTPAQAYPQYYGPGATPPEESPLVSMTCRCSPASRSRRRLPIRWPMH